MISSSSGEPLRWRHGVVTWTLGTEAFDAQDAGVNEARFDGCQK